MPNWQGFIEGTKKKLNKGNIAKKGDIRSTLREWVDTLQFPKKSTPEMKAALVECIAGWMKGRSPELLFVTKDKCVQFRAWVYTVTVTQDTTKKASGMFSIASKAAYKPNNVSNGQMNGAHAEEKWYDGAKGALPNQKATPQIVKETNLTFTSVVGYSSTAPCTEKCSLAFAELADHIGGPIMIYSEENYGHLGTNQAKPGPIVLFTPAATAAVSVGTLDKDQKYKLDWFKKALPDAVASFAQEPPENDNDLDDYWSQVEAEAYVHHDVEGDGNCLFRAISYAISESENNHMQYRARAVQYMRGHAQDFPYLADLDLHETDEEYLNEMSQWAGGADDRKRWGGYPEIVALAFALSTPVVVHARQLNGGRQQFPDPLPVDRVWMVDQTIHLGWAGENHYVALTPKPQ